MTKTVTIQRTSKPLKAAKLVANVIQLIGLFLFVVAIGREQIDAVPFAIGVFVFGVVMHVIAAILVWWNHD